ncbi:hypothetical protein [Vallitalea guaymasensis]|uniref:hypothetical protein n=1 Tax=Vallitalea guaymasensis TaxID=1185412 RepID=UPI000DE20AFE|nr:hypothetical protein [Vallitalea guaymasensis]
MRVDIKRTIIYNELSDKERVSFFDNKGSKFLHNIDNLYYGIVVKGDFNGNEVFENMFNTLRSLKARIRVEGVNPEYKGLIVKPGVYGLVYRYKLSCPDRFDIFLADFLPNENTPRINVQIRSHGIWLDGVKALIKESYEKVEELFIGLPIQFECIKENRVDYAYHTNYMSNPQKFFSDDNLKKHLYASLIKYHKVGDVKNNTFGKVGLTVDYFSLGQRKSNNLFFRTYNKTKEVVERGYKAFFFPLWYEHGLISYYDKYCLEIAYKKKNYRYVHRARLEFYLEYGKNEKYKKEITDMLSRHKTTYKDCEVFADKLLPKVTEIVNVEYETKHKFYSFSDKFIDSMPCSKSNVVSWFASPDIVNRLYRILDNRKVFLDYLTSKTVAFLKDNTNVESGYQEFWKRLRRCKVDCMSPNTTLKRVYNNMVDVEAMITRTVNSVGTTSVYKSMLDSSFTEDISDLLSNYNDNDNENDNIRDRKFKLLWVDESTGEIMNDAIDDMLRDKYSKQKLKKYKVIKNKLPQQITRHSNKPLDNESISHDHENVNNSKSTFEIEQLFLDTNLDN